MEKQGKFVTALLAGTAMVCLAGQAAAKGPAIPVYNCGSCHQQGAGEIWGTLVPGSQTDSSFKVQTGKETWTVRYDQASKLKKMTSVKDLSDEKAVKIKVKAEGGNQAYAEEVSAKSNFTFKKSEDVITVAEVVELLKKSPKEGNYMIADARGYDNYIEGHLPNAVLIPYYEFQAYKDRMPADKNTLIVVYCRGYG